MMSTRSDVVVHALRAGLARSFESSDVQFVLADAGSTDRTREVVREIVGRPHSWRWVTSTVPT